MTYDCRMWLRGAAVLMFLLGLTWTFGLLYLNIQTIVWAYVFTAFNSLQGLFIFLFHCVQNDKVGFFWGVFKSYYEVGVFLEIFAKKNSVKYYIGFLRH